jgi:hypothetical protein
MDRVVDRAGALDVHKEQVTACVRAPGEDGRSRVQEVREFKTTVRGLLGMADWLKAHGVTVFRWRCRRADHRARRGDGGHRRVLAPCLAGAGGRL